MSRLNTLHQASNLSQLAAMALSALVVIKNTFIDVPTTVEAAPTRRSNSVPPALRLCALEPNVEAAGDVLPAPGKSLETSRGRDSSPALVAKPYTASEASTEEPVEEEDSSSADIASVAEVARCAIPLATTTTPEPSRMKLSSKAKAWEPAMTLQDPALDAFAVEVEQLMSRTKLAVETAASAAGVESVIATGWQGSALQIRIRQDYVAMAEVVLTIAKQALLQSADLSAATYVLGYKGQPFQPQLGGFVATVGALWDTSHACWDTYMWGCCNRSNCRWQHPAQTAVVSVVLEVVVSSEGADGDVQLAQ